VSAAPTSRALVVADYAVATASHERPSHVVNADDVFNAVATTRVNPTNLVLESDLGQIPDNPRLIVFLSPTLYRSTCVYFPNKINGAPKIVSCPPEASAAAVIESQTLNLSRNVIAVAASHGRAVSGADVIAAARAQKDELAATPTFRAGQGGKVKFNEQVSNGTSTIAAVVFCVLFPKTAYGIPKVVNC
jgi:hypothetical protein